MPQKVGILVEQRLIQAEAGPEIGKIGGGGALSQHDLNRIAGDEMDEGEYERAHSQQHREHKEESAKQEGSQGCRHREKSARIIA